MVAQINTELGSSKRYLYLDNEILIKLSEGSTMNILPLKEINKNSLIGSREDQ